MMLFAAAVGTATVLWVLGWTPGKVASGVAFGAPAWAAIDYAVAVHSRLPQGPLEQVPADAQWDSPDSSRRLIAGLALSVVVVVALACAIDLLGLGSAFVPGQFIGLAAAKLVGAWRVSRWEHRYRARVAFRFNDGELEMLSVQHDLALNT
jgi:hypothetical protein